MHLSYVLSVQNRKDSDRNKNKTTKQLTILQHVTIE